MNASRKERKGRKEGGKFSSETATPFFGQSVHDAFDAVFQMNLTNADQKAVTPLTQAKLRQHLPAVNRNELLHGFKLHNHFVLDEQIGTKAFIEHEFVVTNGNRNLSLHTKTLFLQLIGQRHFVDGFQQSGPGARVNLEGHVEDDFGNFIFTQRCCLGIFHRMTNCAATGKNSRPASRKDRNGRKGSEWTEASVTRPIYFSPLRPSRPLREAK